MTASAPPPPLSLPRGLLYLSVACTVSALGALAMALAGLDPLPLPVFFLLPIAILAWCLRRWLAPRPSVPVASDGEGSA